VIKTRSLDIWDFQVRKSAELSAIALRLISETQGSLQEWHPIILENVGVLEWVG
jgi:hypothetical protein